MKVFETMIEIYPREKTTASGQKLIEEHGGLGYNWMGAKTFVSSHASFVTPKTQYKTHQNGRGIETWQCKQCDKILDDIKTKSVKKKLCDDCLAENKKLRDMIRRTEKQVCGY